MSKKSVISQISERKFAGKINCVFLHFLIFFDINKYRERWNQNAGKKLLCYDFGKGPFDGKFTDQTRAQF